MDIFSTEDEPSNLLLCFEEPASETIKFRVLDEELEVEIPKKDLLIIRKNTIEDTYDVWKILSLKKDVTITHRLIADLPSQVTFPQHEVENAVKLVQFLGWKSDYTLLEEFQNELSFRVINQFQNGGIDAVNNVNHLFLILFYRSVGLGFQNFDFSFLHQYSETHWYGSVLELILRSQ